MRKQTIISAIGLILALSLVAIAGEEDFARIEAEKHALMRQVEQMKIRAEQLRLEAMEHELRARQLHTEAARIEVQMRIEMERHKAHFEMAETEQKMHQMFKEAEQLEKRGHIDEAHRLRAHAEEIAGRMHAQMQQEQQRDIEMMERKIAELREASERAEREGHIDEAKRLWDESEHLAEELERRIEDRQREEHMGRMHARVKELAGALEEAERRGRERQADELREEIGGLKREIREQERNMKAEHLEREIHHLLAAAEKAEEQDKGDKADAMRREAEQLERHLHELFEEDSDDQKDDEDEEEVSIEEVPRIVKTIILKHAKGGDIEEIERENRDGAKIYEVEIIAGDEEIELKVERNGKIISKKVKSRWDDEDVDEDDDEDEDYEYDDDDDSDELWEKVESLHRQLAELNEAVEHLRNKLK